MECIVNKGMNRLFFYKNKSLFIEYTSVLFFGYILTLAIAPVWQKNVSAVHTLFEMICIIMSSSTFFILWNTVREKNRYNIISCGFLMIVIFNTLHTFYYTGLDQVFGGYFGLSIKYCIIGHLIEGAFFLLLCINIPYIRINRWLGLIAALSLSAVIGWIIYYFPSAFPAMLTEKGITSEKIVLEYVVILFFLVSVYVLRKDINSKDQSGYRYIFIALMTATASELCFIFSGSSDFFYITLGHILKIIYYFYVYKSIFVTLVLHPYEKLNKVNEKMLDILNNFPTGILMIDDISNVSFINKRGEELLEIPKEDFIGMNIEKFELKLGSKAKYSFLKKILEAEAQFMNKVVKYSIRGKLMKFSVSAKKFENGVIILFNDAAKEQQLENLQLQSQMILNSISNLVLVINDKEEIILCNRAARDTMEVNESIIGTKLYDIVKIIQFDKKDIFREIANKKETNEEVSIITQSGNRKEVQIHYSPIYNVDKEIIGAIVIGSDITEIKKQQDKAFQQEKLALIGQLGASIVHETKNFLAIIKSSSQILQLYSKEDKVKQYAEKIDKSTEEINKIISGMLTLGKPRELEIVRTSLTDIMDSIKGILETSALMKGVEMIVLSTEEKKYVLCDEGQIRQVILNIVRNAIESMDNSPCKQLTIAVRYINTSDEAFIQVIDKGKGMKKEVMEKLGTPFFTTKETGTGLGLSVCFKIIKDHGGRIKVISKEGKGTSFKIFLPICE